MEQILQTIVDFMDMIYPYLVAILPAITATGAILIALIKILKAFKDLRSEVKDKTDITEAKNEMARIIRDNASLRKRMDKLIEIQSKVVQYDEEV